MDEELTNLQSACEEKKEIARDFEELLRKMEEGQKTTDLMMISLNDCGEKGD